MRRQDGPTLESKHSGAIPLGVREASSSSSESKRKSHSGGLTETDSNGVRGFLQKRRLGAPALPLMEHENGKRDELMELRWLENWKPTIFMEILIVVGLGLLQQYLTYILGRKWPSLGQREPSTTGFVSSFPAETTASIAPGWAPLVCGLLYVTLMLSQE